MAENKKSFILYADQIHIFNGLDDDEAGRLIKHIFAYINDRQPVPDKITKIAFEPIKQHLKRDLEEWNTVIEKRSKSGRLGGIKCWEVRKLKQNEVNEANEASASKNEANEASASKMAKNEANEAVNVNVNVNVNKEDINVSGKIPTAPILPEKEKKELTQIQKADRVIDCLNKISGKNFKHTKAHRGHIMARISEGFTGTQFRDVIAWKVKEWQGTENAKFIRPETLFGNKFDGYLQSIPKNINSEKTQYPDYQKFFGTEDTLTTYKDYERKLI